MNQVIETIWQQLGGVKFAAMTGAKNLACSDYALSFKIGRNASKSNHVRIELNGKDLYDIQFGHIRKDTFTVDKVYNDIYAEQLVPVFEEYTGLKTKLF